MLDERVAHILYRHPEVLSLWVCVRETLENPDKIKRVYTMIKCGYITNFTKNMVSTLVR